MTKTLQGRPFEKVGNNYIYNYSRRHSVIIIPIKDGWEAKEIKVPDHGNYVDGTKKIQIVRSVKSNALIQAATDIFEVTNI